MVDMRARVEVESLERTENKSGSEIRDRRSEFQRSERSELRAKMIRSVHASLCDLPWPIDEGYCQALFVGIRCLWPGFTGHCNRVSLTSFAWFKKRTVFL